MTTSDFVSSAQAESAAHQAARRYVHQLRGFYTHLFFYVAANAMMISINLLTSPHYLWFWFPLLGWGLGLTAHALGVFGRSLIFSRHWEQRQMDRYLQRHHTLPGHH